MNNFSMDRIPPQNIDAEQSILSAILIDNQALIDISEILQPDDFYKSAHIKIYSAMLSLSAKGEPIDLVTLSDEIKSNNNLESVGGSVYLAKIIDECPTPSNVKNYAQIISDKATLRRIIVSSSETINDCYELREPDVVLCDAKKRIDGISCGNETGSCVVGDVLESVIENLESRKQGEITGVPSGFSRLDYLLGGFQKTDNIVLAARPAMGKTAFAMNVLRQASLLHEIPTAIFSLEMSKEQLTKRLVAMVGRIDGGKFLTNSLSGSDWEKINDASVKISRAPIHIDDRSGLHYREVRRKLRRLVEKDGVELAVIDYLQLMTGDKSNGRTGEVGSVSRAVKGMAKDFGIPILLISQLSRKCEERSDKRPMLSDLRDSGEIEQDADIVMFIYRDEVYNLNPDNPLAGTAEILISKHREGDIGVIDMAFLKKYQLFQPLDFKYS